MGCALCKVCVCKAIHTYLLIWYPTSAQARPRQHTCWLAPEPWAEWLPEAALLSTETHANPIYIELIRAGNGLTLFWEAGKKLTFIPGPHTAFTRITVMDQNLLRPWKMCGSMQLLTQFTEERQQLLSQTRGWNNPGSGAALCPRHRRYAVPSPCVLCIQQHGGGSGYVQTKEQRALCCHLSEALI